MNKKAIVWIVVVILAAGGLAAAFRPKKNASETVQVISPAPCRIVNDITATATVQPQNRLEIKPPFNGRIEKILVHEGDMVKSGQVLALMSSTERAALLDAARLKGPKELKYWEEVYKPTPLLAPIAGQVIVRSVEPGQTVTTADDVVVLSDRLIVQAQVDETDIGKVKLGQKADIVLDAYPNITVKGTVDHIYYESTIVNNVTIYRVDIVPAHVPSFFRSGMSANVRMIVQESNGKNLCVPMDAVKEHQGEKYVMVSQGRGKPPVRREVTLGMTDDANAEVTSGLGPQDKVVVTSQKYVPPTESNNQGSPFFPGHRRSGGNKSRNGGNR